MRTINAQVTGARQQQLFTAGEQNHGVSQFLELDLRIAAMNILN